MRRTWRAFERGFLGKGRPRVGSRRRDRLPRGMLHRPAARQAAAVARTATQPVNGPARRATEQPQSGPSGLAFAVILVVLAGGLGFGLVWAAGEETGFLARALGAAASSSPRNEATAAPAPTSVAPTAGPATATPEPRSYVVQPGDTLLSIAARHGTTVDRLAEANHLENPELLTVGTRLVIPEG